MQAVAMSVAKIAASSTNMTLPKVANERCDLCRRKKFLDENNKAYCWHCKEIAPQDVQLAQETLVIQKRNQVISLYDSFADNSLINDKLKKATFDNYVPPTKELSDAKKTIMDFVSTYSKEDPTSMIITGDYGVGKSHLCVAATKELMKRGYSAMFIQMNKLFTKIKSTWNKNSDLTEDKLMSLLAKVDVLIIDDFGAEFTERDKEGVTWKQTKTNEIVDSRIGKSTLFTTNFSVDQLAEMYGERDFSRMMENAEMLEMFGDNYRLRNFKKGE
ncbi:ATP-binding protein [Bacillus cereus group sp. BfR-BA-01317]|uniref:ATP-binding protein n=1 Tax=Bacillus cereus group sp. BfR-BA-01317 TaxID=2920294 RepID=UPI0035ABE10F